MRYIELPVDELARRYMAGESTLELGLMYGVSYQTVRGRLLAAGVKMRPGCWQQGNQYGLGNKNARSPSGPLADGGKGYLRTVGRNGKNCFVHRGCWEAHHGPIPEGYVIHHADENRRHNEIANLTCLSRGEHTRLHKGEGLR